MRLERRGSHALCCDFAVRFLEKINLHLRIRRTNQSSFGLNPQKVLPSPPKFHGSVTSIGLFGSRSYWPLPIIIRSRRRNLRLQNRFPRFCDLQQQQVLAGVFFLLLLIVSRMLRVAYAFSCHPVKHYETEVFGICVILLLFSTAKITKSPNRAILYNGFPKILSPFPSPKEFFPIFVPAISGEIDLARESAFFALFLNGELAQFA